MANRIEIAIREMRESLRGVPPARQESLKRKLDLSLLEFCKYQDEQAIAHAGGKITYEEARTVYVALGGETPGPDGGWPRETDLAARIIVTKLMVELMTRRQAEHRPQRPKKNPGVTP